MSLTSSKLVALCLIICASYTIERCHAFFENIIKPRVSSPIPPENREISLPTTDRRFEWGLGSVAFSLLPLAPGRRRKTLIEEVVPGTVWTLDQIQGVVNVNVPVRAVIVRLQEGGLLIYNPVAPTQECLDYVKDLESAYGEVKHILLGSLGLEHKALCGPFTRSFPRAEVWLQPGQWSFPVNLPSWLFGFPVGSRLKDMPRTSAEAPWKSDFETAVLGPLKFKSVGGFGETALFHKSSKTLIITDTVIKVADDAPPILQEDPRAILYHSRDEALDDVEDTDDSRRRGWRRMALFGLFFYPAGIQVSSVPDAFAVVPKATEKSKVLGEGSIPFNGALYPWTWVINESRNFKALQNGLLVAPILQKLILDREPDRVLEWVDTVSQWPIKRIIPSHFENDVKASRSDFRKAFRFLEGQKPPADIEDDLFLLNLLSDIFTKVGIVAPSQVNPKL